MLDLEKIFSEVGSFFDEWRATGERMSRDNQPINPNKDFFDRLERELKERIQNVSCKPVFKLNRI